MSRKGFEKVAATPGRMYLGLMLAGTENGQMITGSEGVWRV
jgi:hypothetical protein